MPPHAQRSRLAIGVYDGLAALCPPVATILQLGLDPNQLGIIAVAPLVSRAIRPAGVSQEEWSRLAAMLADAAPIPACEGPPPLLLASRTIPGLDEAGNWLCPRISGERQTLAPRVPASLETLIRRGYPALAVVPRSSQQQRQCMQALLSSSLYPVETHEFTKRA